MYISLWLIVSKFHSDISQRNFSVDRARGRGGAALSVNGIPDRRINFFPALLSDFEIIRPDRVCSAGNPDLLTADRAANQR